jgi:hypothetical protein
MRITVTRRDMKKVDQRVTGAGVKISIDKIKIMQARKAIETYFQRVLNTRFMSASSFVLIGWVVGSAMSHRNHELTTGITMAAIAIQSLLVIIPSVLWFILFLLTHNAKLTGEGGRKDG